MNRSGARRCRTRNPERTLVDAGYCSTNNINAAADTDRDLLVATGGLRHHEQVAGAPSGRIPKNATSRERMARRLRTEAGRTTPAVKQSSSRCSDR